MELTGKSFPQATIDYYIEELKNIETEPLTAALKTFMSKSKWPSVEEIEQLCGIETHYSEADHNASEALKSVPKADLTNDIINNETMCYRIEAPAPACTDLHESVKYWKEKLRAIKAAGWKVFTWSEHEGVRKTEEQDKSKTVIKKQRIFYVMCFVCRPDKPQGVPFAKCDFKADNKPYVTEWNE